MLAVRFDVGDDVVSAVREAAEKHGITAGSVMGIGATDCFTVGVYDPAKKAYDEFEFTGSHEITSLTGNVTTMNGKTYVHLHITCAGAGGKIVGGHLLRARVSVTGEAYINICPAVIEREYDPSFNFNRIVFR